MKIMFKQNMIRYAFNLVFESLEQEGSRLEASLGYIAFSKQWDLISMILLKK